MKLPIFSKTKITNHIVISSKFPVVNFQNGPDTINAVKRRFFFPISAIRNTEELKRNVTIETFTRETSRPTLLLGNNNLSTVSSPNKMCFHKCRNNNSTIENHCVIILLSLILSDLTCFCEVSHYTRSTATFPSIIQNTPRTRLLIYTDSSTILCRFPT